MLAARTYRFDSRLLTALDYIYALCIFKNNTTSECDMNSQAFCFKRLDIYPRYYRKNSKNKLVSYIAKKQFGKTANYKKSIKIRTFCLFLHF